VPALPYRYLLDTHIVPDLVREPQGSAARRIATRDAGEFSRVPGLKVAPW
jgi:predicted nucleic acid-binding protein